jgi:toxin FitB
MSMLVDTNVISEVAKAKPNPTVLAWLGAQPELGLSVISVDELWFGLTAKPHQRLREQIEYLIDAHCRVFDITAEIARHAGVLRGQLARRGRIREQPDMLIAATAAVHGLTLATRNTRDFKDCGILLFDPFND